MLKIKDNIDLKELGFKEYDCLWFDKESYMQIDKENNKIIVIDYSLDKLYDLIKADMVEKVVEE